MLFRNAVLPTVNSTSRDNLCYLRIDEMESNILISNRSTHPSHRPSSPPASLFRLRRQLMKAGALTTAAPTIDIEDVAGGAEAGSDIAALGPRARVTKRQLSRDGKENMENGSGEQVGTIFFFFVRVGSSSPSGW